MFLFGYKCFPILLFFATSSAISSSSKDVSIDLESAILRNDLKTVKKFLNLDKKKSQITEREWKIACIAAQTGNQNIIEFITERNQSILQRKDENNYTIGHIAAEYGQPDIVMFWVSKVERQSFISLCRIAAKKGHLNVIEEHVLNCLEESIAQLAASHGHLDIACYVAERRSGQCIEYKNAIQTAFEKCQKRDDETLKLIVKLACKWEKGNNCPSIVDLIDDSKDESKLIQHLAQERCTLFVMSNHAMEIAFQKNLIVDQNFLECLEENNALQKKIGSEGDTITHIALKLNRSDVFQLLVKRNSSICFTENAGGETVFEIASKRGYADIVRNAVRENPLDMMAKDRMRWNLRETSAKTTIFNWAVENNFMDMDTLKYLVEKKKVPLIKTDPEYNETVAHTAAITGKMEILQYLVEKEPSILTIADYWGNTVLHNLASYVRLNIEQLKFFVANGAPLRAKNMNNETVAHILAHKNERTDLLEYLVEKDPSILTIADFRGNTLLHIIAKKSQISMETLKLLVDKGASLTTRNWDDNTVVHNFAARGYTDFVEYLVEKEPSVLTMVNKDGDTILHLLAKKNTLSVKSLELFLNQGAPLHINNKEADDIAVIATRAGNVQLLDYLWEKEPSFFAKNASAFITISDEAANHSHSGILKLLAKKVPHLLAQRTNILFYLQNASDTLDTLLYLRTMCETEIPNWINRRHFESQVLCKIIEYDYANMLKYMKYDANVVHERGEPLIFTAVRRERPNIFYYLATDGKANLTALDSEGNNILFAVAKNRDLEKIKYVLDTLKAPINIEWRNNVGDTLLHVAVREALDQETSQGSQSQDESGERPPNDISVIEYLVEQKHADINARGYENKTVLNCATSRANYYISNYLLDHGADPKLQDSIGHNFWQSLQFPARGSSTDQDLSTS